MAEIIETSERSDDNGLQTVHTVKATWGEFSIDADKASEAVAELLSHYYRSIAGGYTLGTGWAEKAINNLDRHCVIGRVEHPTNNAGCRV